MLTALPIIDYATHPDYAGLTVDPKNAERAAEEFFPILRSKRESLALCADGFDRRPRAASESVLGALARDGVAALALPRPILNRLREAAAPHAAALKQRAKALIAAKARIRFDDTLHPVLQWDEAAPGCEVLAAAVRDLLREIDFDGIAQRYYPGFRPTVAGAALKRNFAGHEIFRANGAHTTLTGGLHIDSNSAPMMNGIVYLNEVGPEQGPFSYVVGSHRWPFDVEDRAIRKAMDECAFGSQKGREFFAAIPAEYQRKCAFGWDILDGTPECDALISTERVFTSQDCDLVLFDSDGVHRGGDVAKGKRLSILFNVAMRPI